MAEGGALPGFPFGRAVSGPVGWATTLEAVASFAAALSTTPAPVSSPPSFASAKLIPSWGYLGILTPKTAGRVGHHLSCIGHHRYRWDQTLPGWRRTPSPATATASATAFIASLAARCAGTAAPASSPVPSLRLQSFNLNLESACLLCCSGRRCGQPLSQRLVGPALFLLAEPLHFCFHHL